MNKQECILLFNYLHPDFFESESVRALPEEYVFDEMILYLNEFDSSKYNKQFEDSISFGFYNGGMDELRKKVEKVEQQITAIYTIRI